MQKMAAIKVPQTIDNYWRYPDPWKQISEYMRVNGLVELGALNYLEKFKMENGELRSGGIWLDRIERALRTLTIKKLSKDELERVHRYETEKMTRFLTFPEIRVISRNLKLKSSGSLNESQIEAIVEFNEKNRPLCRKISDITVPPYFPLDNEFDGMEYHHSWDLSCWHNEFILPDSKDAKRSKDKLMNRFNSIENGVND